MGQDETAKTGEAAHLELTEKQDTPEEFLAELSDVLKESDGVDTDLAAILTDHLLKVTPRDNAVANAKSAIIALASKRVAPADENANG